MNSTTKAGIDIPDERLRIIIEEEITRTACQPFLHVKTMTSLHDKLPVGSSNLSRYFRKASNGGGLEMHNPSGFLRSHGLDWYIFALAKFNGKPSGLAFAFLKGIHRILQECARQIGAPEPTLVDSMILYFRYRIMKRAKKKKEDKNGPDPPFVEFGVLSFELASYVDELRTELKDSRYELPPINQTKVEKVVKDYYYLWLSIGQGLVKEKIDAVIV